MSSITKPTPPSKPPLYNFGSASSRDKLLFGCARPGHAHPKIDTPRTPRGPPVEKTDLKKWIEFLRTRGVKHVICLLSQTELTFFSQPFLKTIASAGFTVTHVPPAKEDGSDGGALEKLEEVMDHAANSNERVVVHCASGQKRTGDVLALWLHRRYRMSVEKAVEEVTTFASDHRLLRRPSVQGVLRYLAPKALLTARRRSTPPLPPGWSIGGGSAPTSDGTAAAGDAKKDTTAKKNAASFHITVLQMGGEIDRGFSAADVTRTVIGAPAVVDILRRLPAPRGFTFDGQSVCRKDGRHVGRDDRKRLLDACVRSASSKLLVTHGGGQGMVDTAMFLRCDDRLGSKTVVVTGAKVPACVGGERSDATFNIGVAFGALNVLRRGVFVCMDGRIFESSRCVFSEKTGALEKKGPSASAKSPSSRTEGTRKG